jgi:glycosyltransferase involved in cell wall biosynthesis
MKIDRRLSCATVGRSDRPDRLAAITILPPRITILLSTYNGAPYLKSQLNSFRQQADVDWRLVWRDDGSNDASEAIMQEFAMTAGAGRCVKSPSSGPHLGAAASFLRLLSENQDSPFIAFADQDDHWLPEKLHHSLRQLGNPGSLPALYCARQILTDAAFNHPKPSMKFQGRPGFPACLTQNAATGNTVVMNQAAARLISEIPAPEASTHDWWSYIVVSACGGKVVYDAVPSMLYRQHATNMIGSNMRTIGRAVAALRRGPHIYMTMMRRHIDRLEEYRDRLDRQAVADLQLIRKGLAGGYADRISALRCPFFTRATKLETLLFRLWFLTC